MNEQRPSKTDLYAPENVVAYLRNAASQSLAGKQFAYAADKIERLERDVKLLEIVGREQAQRIAELKQDLARTESARVAILAENTHYKQHVAEMEHSFKNFHRLLCERFNYVHDEKDWQRDQLSLIEHIAQRASAPPSDALRAIAERIRDTACAYGAPANELRVERELIGQLARVLAGTLPIPPVTKKDVRLERLQAFRDMIIAGCTDEMYCGPHPSDLWSTLIGECQPCKGSGVVRDANNNIVDCVVCGSSGVAVTKPAHTHVWKPWDIPGWVRCECGITMSVPLPTETEASREMLDIPQFLRKGND